MLALTRKTEYALIAVCHLARHRERVVSARDIAERHGIPLPLLMNVMKTLNQGGVLRSLRGARGGYRLAAAPDELTLAGLIEAVEGPVRLVRCAPLADAITAGRTHSCELIGMCPVRMPIQRVHDRFRDFLAQVTIADIAYDVDYEDSPRLAVTKVLAQ